MCRDIFVGARKINHLCRLCRNNPVQFPPLTICSLCSRTVSKSCLSPEWTASRTADSTRNSHPGLFLSSTAPRDPEQTKILCKIFADQRVGGQMEDTHSFDSPSSSQSFSRVSNSKYSTTPVSISPISTGLHPSPIASENLTATQRPVCLCPVPLSGNYNEKSIIIKNKTRHGELSHSFGRLSIIHRRP